MKQLLLLGDSIRLGYQEEVAGLLANEYEVWGSPDNGRFAKYTLNELERIFESYGRSPDIIHWNNGLWDSAIVCAEDGAFTPLDEYERYMRLILRELRKRCKKIIFATTTPVRPIATNQRQELIQAMNARILSAMKQEHVPINDLYALLYGREDEYICGDGIHLTEAGKKICGHAITTIVRKIGSETYH